MIPPWNSDGLLPVGEHLATWNEVRERFGSTPSRRRLLQGLARACSVLANAGCRRVWLDGSFVTDTNVTKQGAEPADYDGAWDGRKLSAPMSLPPQMFITSAVDAQWQKQQFGGELYPHPLSRGIVQFFQTERDSTPKGIVFFNPNEAVEP